MENTVYTINTTRTVQTSPDDLETYPVCIELDESTTIGQIRALLAKEFKTSPGSIDLRGMKIGVIHKVTSL